MTRFADFTEIFAPYVDADTWQAIADLPISGIVSDSRAVKQGEVFTLLSVNPDTAQKAKSYITGLNSVAVLSEISASDMGFDTANPPPMPIVHIADLRLMLGDFIQAYLQAGQAVNLPKIIATTGTNGKTTISQLTAQLIDNSGMACAIMGTAGNGRLANLVQSTHTTSEVGKVHEFLHRMGADGVQVVSLEASSHGLHQHRLQGVPVEVAIFSNLSRDHLDYHSDMDDYAATKAMLFDKGYFKGLHHAIINIDDEFGARLASGLQRRLTEHTLDDLTLWTYSTQNPHANFFADNIRPSLSGVDMDVSTPFGKLSLTSPLLGLFNVGNLLASMAGFLALYPMHFDKLPQLVARLQGARGRMQRVETTGKQGCFIVDYAHTPDALVQVLTSLKAHCTGDLWAVFGCGGDRDKGKRPLMAKAGVSLADKVVLTADNPRSEDPLMILKDMQAGLSCEEHYKVIIEPDRRQAITYALTHAKPDDIVVIAGKGHETYQEIKGVRHDFDDVMVIQDIAKNL